MGGDEGGAEGDRGWDDLLVFTDVEHMCGQHTNLAFFGGWAVGQGVYWPQNRSIWIAIALENFAARPCPSLCEIRKAASISSFKHVSEKKARSMHVCILFIFSRIFVNKEFSKDPPPPPQVTVHNNNIVPLRLFFAAPQRIAITLSPNYYQKNQRFTTRKHQEEHGPDVM